MQCGNDIYLHEDTGKAHDGRDVVAAADDHVAVVVHGFHCLAHRGRLLVGQADHLGQLDVAVDRQHSDGVLLAHGADQGRLNGGSGVGVRQQGHDTQHDVIGTRAQQIDA